MNSNYLGKVFLVEECQKINMKDYLRRAKVRLKETLLTAEISLCETPVRLVVSRTGFGGTRHWFACPVCESKLGVLFVHPVSKAVGCRKCLNLEYRKRRFKGMIESL